MDIGAVPVHAAHLGLIRKDVLGVAGRRVGEDEAAHAAHAELRVVPMSIAYDAGRSHKLVMECLVALLRGRVRLGGRAGEAADYGRLEEVAHVHRTAVDLVERESIAHLVLVAVEDGLTVFLEEADELAAGPAAVLLDEVVGP